MTNTTEISLEKQLSITGLDASEIITATDAQLFRPEHKTTYETYIGGHPRSIYDLLLHPSQPWLITASRDHTLRLWCLESLICLNIFRGHKDYVDKVILHPDEKRIISAGRDGTLRLWDLITAKCLQIFSYKDIAIYSIFANDDYIIAGDGKGHVLVWNYNGSLKTVIDAHENEVTGIWFDNKYIYSAGKDAYLKKWNLETKALIWQKKNHQSEINTMCSDSQTNCLYTAGNDKTIIRQKLADGSPVQIYKGHTEGIIALSMNTDKHSLISVSYDGTVRLWDSDSAELSYLHCYMSPNNRVSYLADKNLFLLAHRGEIYAIDLETAQYSHKYESNDNSSIYAISKPSSDQNVFLSLHNNSESQSQIKVWDIKTTHCLKEIELSIEPDNLHVLESRKLVAVIENYKAVVQIWNYQSGKMLAEFRLGEGLEVDGLAINWAVIINNGNHVVIACRGLSENIRIWDINKKYQIATQEGHEDSVMEIAKAGNANRLASASADGFVRVFNTSAQPGKWPCLFKSKKCDHWYQNVAISDDGTVVAASTSGGRIDIWNIDTGLSLPAPQKANRVFRELFFSSDGKILFACRGGEYFHVWSIENKTSIRSWKGEPPPNVNYYNGAEFDFQSNQMYLINNNNVSKMRLTEFSSKKYREQQAWNVTHIAMQGYNRLVLATFGGGIKVLDLSSGKITRQLTKEPEIQHCHASKSGRIAACNSYTLSIYSATEPDLRGGYIGHTKGITRTIFNSSGESIFTASADGDARRWSYHQRHCQTLYKGQGKSLTTLALSSNEKNLIAGDEDGNILSWDTYMPGLFRSFHAHNGKVTAIASLAGGDQKRFISGGEDGYIHIWHIDYNKPLVSIAAHQDAVRGLSSSPEGKWILSGSDDRTARLWRVQSKSKINCEYILKGHDGKVTSTIITPLSEILITAGWDGTLRFWSRSRKKQLAVYHVYSSGYLWTTPPDSQAPYGWFHTDRPDLIDIIAKQEGSIPQLVEDKDTRDSIIKPYLNESMIMNRLNNFDQYQKDLKLLKVNQIQKEFMASQKLDKKLRELSYINNL